MAACQRKRSFHPNATHATQAIAFGWKPGFTLFLHCFRWLVPSVFECVIMCLSLSVCYPACCVRRRDQPAGQPLSAMPYVRLLEAAFCNLVHDRVTSLSSVLSRLIRSHSLRHRQYDQRAPYYTGWHATAGRCGVCVKISLLALTIIAITSLYLQHPLSYNSTLLVTRARYKACMY